MPDAEWDAAAAPLNVESLPPGRQLRVTGISLSRLNNLIQVDYEMRPAMDPGLSDDATEEAERERAIKNEWVLTGVDDLGNDEYEDRGGVRGTPKGREGELTDGVRDLWPAPPENARWIDITFHGGGRGSYRNFTLRVNLPLRQPSGRRRVQALLEAAAAAGVHPPQLCVMRYELEYRVARDAYLMAEQIRERDAEIEVDTSGIAPGGGTMVVRKLVTPTAEAFWAVEELVGDLEDPAGRARIRTVSIEDVPAVSTERTDLGSEPDV